MRTFRNRLLILLIGLVVGAQTVTLFTSLARTASTERTRADSQLAGGAQVARELIRYRERQLDSAVTVLAADFGLREAIATSDTGTVASALGNHSTRIGAQLSLAMDLDGHLIAMGEGDHPVTNEIARVLLRSALEDTRNNSFVVVGDTAYQVFVAAVRAPDEIGWVAMGFALDAELARDLGELVGVEVLFIEQHETRARILSATLADLPPETKALPGTAASREPTTLDMQGIEYLAATTWLTGTNPAIGIALLKPMDEVMAPYRELSGTLGAIVGATLLAAIIAGIYLGRSAASPIQRLSAGAMRVARGDYGTTVEAGGGKELTELAQAFNVMQSGIAEREERLLHGARHDPITGLPNRRHAEDWLEQRIGRLAPNEEVVVVLLAITNLQELSAGLGFEFAEQLVRHLARVLDRAQDDLSLVARLDTGRFAVLTTGLEQAKVDHFAEELHRIAMLPLSTGGVTLRLNVVAGVALAPIHGSNAVEVLRCAEAAAEAAIANRQRISFFERASDEAQRRRLKIGVDLPRALAADQLRLVFQPKVGMLDRRTISAEVLARWRHPELGEIPPIEFVTIAERTGASSQLTRWVLRAALRQLSSWHADGIRIELAVNLSATDIADPELLEFILEALREVKVPAGSLTLEITESVFMVDADRAIRNMELLRVAGVRFSVDDFGTGYSSLSQLRQLAVDELKIDQSFVRALTDDPENAAIIRSIIDLGHGLGLRVVAEGIETEAQWKQLAEMGCDYAQGYLISRPVPAEMLEVFVHVTAKEISDMTTHTQVLRVLKPHNLG